MKQQILTEFSVVPLIRNHFALLLYFLQLLLTRDLQISPLTRAKIDIGHCNVVFFLNLKSF